MSIDLFEETSNFRIVSESEYKVLRIKVFHLPSPKFRVALNQSR
jgi:hypothetical protein